MNTSGNSYASLYPFPFDLNQDAQWQEQEYQAKTCVPQDETMENDSGVKLSVWKTEELFLGHHRYCSDNSDLSNSCTPRFKDDQKLQPSPYQKLQPSPSPDNRSNSSYKDTIRVCTDCNTTKTPLWRGGPNGPKSLCNACGIRQRKARRAAARAVEVNGSVVVAESSTRPSTKTSKVQRKAPKGLKNNKFKVSCQSKGRKKLCFEDLRRMLSKKSDFHRVFPQDEKEAAVLLMALSYGLVHG